mgnify:CR=1 FL=1
MEKIKLGEQPQENQKRDAIHMAVMPVVAALFAIMGVLVLAAAVLVHTAWGRDRVRDLIVREANRRLAFTLSIGRLVEMDPALSALVFIGAFIPFIICSLSQHWQ